VRQLEQNPVIREAVKRGEVKVVGAFYSMGSGGVEFIEREEERRE
jgi:carbonic anhydrase